MRFDFAIDLQVCEFSCCTNGTQKKKEVGGKVVDWITTTYFLENLLFMAD